MQIILYTAEQSHLQSEEGGVTYPDLQTSVVTKYGWQKK